MLFWATVLCIALYLFPLIAVLVTESSRSLPIWRIALTLPAVAAFDMLGIMALARFTRLETAILVSRPAWLVATAGTVLWRWRARRERPRWPVDLHTDQVLGTAAAAVIAFRISELLSRPYHIWDRHWHVPLVTLFRAERIPFDNAYDPGHTMHYHITGDVLGALFQTLSLGIANSSLALSVAHDVMFGLIGACATLLMFAFGFKRVWPAPLAAIALLLQGPAWMRGNVGAEFYGYSFDNLLIVGFRPHVPLAGLLIVGIVGCVAIRLRHGAQVRSAYTVPVLLACGALLAITDEASMGIIGLALAIAWCAAPRALARSRLGGIAVLAALGVSIIVMHRLFNGSLSPGGPVQSVEWVRARSPGSLHFDALALTSSAGRAALFIDLLPLLACAAGFTLAAMEAPPAFGALAFVWAVMAISLFLFTRLEVNHTHQEAQRFMIAPSFVVLMFALLQVTRVPHGSIASAGIVGGLALAAFSTVSWLRQRVTDCESENVEQQRPNLHTMNCRESTGARFGETPTVAYFDSAIFAAYTGCHPSYAVGGLDAQWGIKLFPHLDSLQQLEQLGSEMVAPDRDLVAICATPPSKDALCLEAERRALCVGAGKDTRRCVLSPGDREAILRGLKTK
jgi:hypothetical protein